MSAPTNVMVADAKAKGLAIPPRTMRMEVYSGAPVEGRQPVRELGGGKDIVHDSDAAYRCPKCGATSALLLPARVIRESHVALKCLQCAHVLRMPRHRLEGTAGFDSTSALE